MHLPGFHAVDGTISCSVAAAVGHISGAVALVYSLRNFLPYPVSCSAGLMQIVADAVLV